MPTLDAFASLYPDISAFRHAEVDLLWHGVRLVWRPSARAITIITMNRGRSRLIHVPDLEGSVILPDGTTVFMGHNPNSL